MSFNPGRVFCPFNHTLVVLTPFKLYIVGTFLNFGDTVSEYCPPHIAAQLFTNGAIGTREEFESLNGTPLEYSVVDSCCPIAKFVHDPQGFLKEQEEVEDVGGEVFSVENAKLLQGKDDIINYGELFGLTVKKKIKGKVITMKAMISDLESQAIAKGLIEA